VGPLVEVPVLLSFTYVAMWLGKRWKWNDAPDWQALLVPEDVREIKCPDGKCPNGECREIEPLIEQHKEEV
jgi:hypothetical protein